MSAQWNNGLWHAYSDYLSSRFGERVYKVTVSAGFTCPTRDGTKGTRGCSFCDERGSSSYFSAEKASRSVTEQMQKTMPEIAKRFRASKFLAYFQSFTNTYAPVNYLREVYDGAFNLPDVVGMAVGTRPDCVPVDVLALLNGYGRGGRYISLELGLQSLRDEALDFYERGHTVAEGVDAIQRALKFPNLSVSVHLMFGAPGDTVEHAIEAARKMNELGVHGVKIHQLMVLKDTILAERYAKNPWPLLNMDEYNQMAMAFLEHLDPKIHVERTHALSSHPVELVGPEWSAHRFIGLNALKRMMQEKKSYQGKSLGARSSGNFFPAHRSLLS
ncbi:MAG: TIGR01212 family radical SAM protein [Bdellovibrionota bacterium]